MGRRRTLPPTNHLSHSRWTMSTLPGLLSLRRSSVTSTSSSLHHDVDVDVNDEAVHMVLTRKTRLLSKHCDDGPVDEDDITLSLRTVDLEDYGMEEDEQEDNRCNNCTGSHSHRGCINRTACSASVSSATASEQRSVSFGTVQVRKYRQVLGDHPCCYEGCPIQLGWDYVETSAVDVGRYELEQSLCGISKNIHSGDLKLTPQERKQILLQTHESISTNEQSDDDGNCSHDDTESSMSVHHHNTSGDDKDNSTPSMNSHSTKSSDSFRQCATSGSSTAKDTFQSERDLVRACRRLNRTVNKTRNYNRKAQKEFFGCKTKSKRGS